MSLKTFYAVGAVLDDHGCGVGVMGLEDADGDGALIK